LGPDSFTGTSERPYSRRKANAARKKITSSGSSEDGEEEEEEGGNEFVGCEEGMNDFVYRLIVSMSAIDQFHACFLLLLVEVADSSLPVCICSM